MSIFNSLKAQTYKLYIHNDGVDSSKAASTDAAVSRIVVYVGSVTKVTHNGKPLLLSLGGVTFTRKVYQPGHIEAELQVTLPSSATANPTLADLQSMLLRKKVDLDVADADYDDDVNVASNYYIHEICPLFEKDGKNTSIYVRLSIYSMDKLMTVNKFSQAYLGQKLGEQILTTMATHYYLWAYEDSKNPENTRTYGIVPNVGSLQHLQYTPAGAKEPVEFIQPYLVQYNESFYDFLRRTANRCGEFLFFEDGVLCLGLSDKKVTGSAREISDYSRLIYQQISPAPLIIDDYSRNSLMDPVEPPKNGEKGKLNVEQIGKGGFPADAFPKNTNYVNSYNAEVAGDELYMLLYKDQFADENWYDCLGHAETNVMSIISTVLNSTSLLEAITSLATTYAKTLIQGNIGISKTNSDGNKVINAWEGDGADSAVPFSIPDKNTWLTLNYYSDIKKNEEAQQRKMVCVDMGSKFVNVKLGDKISFPDDSQEYVVVQIDLQADQTWTGQYEAYHDQMQDLIGGRMLKIYAIPKVDGKFYPPLCAQKAYRESEPQTAFVMDSADPKGQGRVRIRYSWQANVDAQKETLDKQKKEAEKTLEAAKSALKDDAGNADKQAAYTKAKKALQKLNYDIEALQANTPWIRMATPMATAGGGMRFNPEKGDEVLVNFENGNVERPYVVGTLYSKNVVAPSDKRVIKSPNGHIIKMDDPNDVSKLVSGMYPGMKFLQSYQIWKPDWKLDGDSSARGLLGGITMTDMYGMYKISMSSHDRKVAISSPFGDVKIDAFTGITISAPNGDIKIKGKNVSIEASNNVKIQSGTNIKPINKNGNYLTGGSTLKTVGSKITSTLMKETVGQFLDFSLLRSIFEVFLRPIDGTMELKSYRYLTLGAGNGVPETDAGMYNATGANLRRKSGTDGYAVLGNFMAMVNAKINKYVAEFLPAYNAARRACLALNALNLYGDNAKLETPASWDALLTAMFEVAEAKDELQIEYEYTADALLQDVDNNDNDLRAKLIAATNAIVALKTVAKKYEKVFDHKYNPVKRAIPFFDKFERIYADTCKGILPTVTCSLTALVSSTKEKTNQSARVLSYRNDVTLQTLSGGMKKLKRAVTIKVLEACMSMTVQKTIFVNFKVSKDANAPAVEAAINNQNNEYVAYCNAINFYVADGDLANFGAGLLDGLASAMSGSLSWERNVWLPGTKGDILFSNDSSKTMRFSGNNIVSDDNLYVSQGDKKKVVNRIKAFMLNFA